MSVPRAANALQALLARSREELNLDRYGVDARSAAVLITPRFAASRHVVFILLPRRSPRPALVAKVSRLAGDKRGVDREATVLRALARRGVGAGGSVPGVVAREEIAGHAVLLETALVGRPIDPALVRRRPARTIESVFGWLLALAGEPAPDGSRQLERLVRQPLRTFATLFERDEPERRLAARALDLLERLDGSLPSVVEHGDVSDPNLLLLRDGRLGVLDWEIAELHGLPLHDLSFFLNYVAAAKARARTVAERVTAFHRAFFGQGAWARPYLASYGRRLRLSAPSVMPLFVACWTRYVVGVLERTGTASLDDGPITDDQKRFVRTHAYYALWRHAVDYAEELSIGE
jgi:aminoglycoside phosphotransferase